MEKICFLNFTKKNQIVSIFNINLPDFKNNKLMKTHDNGNAQLNSIRNEFNSRIEGKSYLGRSKRVAWAGNRRFMSI